jgi:cell division transport system permease protein
VRYFALALVALLTIAAAAVIAFAARASLAARWDVAQALHLVGARDSYITGLFQRRFFLLGVKAGLTGSVLAALAAFGLAFAGGAAGAVFFLPTLELGWSAAAIPAVAALVSGFVAAFSARLAVAAELRLRWS